jgi:hypothetical protein
MKRSKYKYNPATLNFEKARYTVRDYIFSGLKYLFAGLVVGTICVVIYASFFKDPETARLGHEIRFLKAQLEELNNQIDTLEYFAHDLQEKDDNVYRSIFGAKQYPDYLRKGGVGGSDRYRNLRGFASSAGIIALVVFNVPLLHRVNPTKSYSNLPTLRKLCYNPFLLFSLSPTVT